MASFFVHFSELSERKREKQKTPAVQVEEKIFNFKYTKTRSLWAAPLNPDTEIRGHFNEKSKN